MSDTIDWKNLTKSKLEGLIKEGFDVNQSLADGRTPLMEIVIENEDPEVITLLIDSVADFDAQDSSGMTALHHASHLCNPAEVELLLNREANLEVQDEFGFTPLARTFFFPKRTDENNYKVVKLLLDAGANVNAWDKKGDSLLMNAVFKYDNPDAVKALIEHGAEIDATNSNGMTPLMLAARNNQNPEIVQTLLDAGAVIKMKDNNGMTAWDHIQENLSLRETKPYRDLKSYFT